MIVSAPSGCGKTTIVEALLRTRGRFKRSVSYTTRKPRAGEKKRRDYHFISRESFLHKRQAGFFLEWARVFGRFYGTSKVFCEKWISNGHDVVLTIDVQGMQKVKRRFGKCFPIVSIFIVPPSIDVLRKRLTKRGTDSEAEIEKRLREAKKEIKQQSHYDFVVKNRTVSQSVRDINKVFAMKKEF